MSAFRFLSSPRARRGLAASAIVLSLGGLVLFRTPAGAVPVPFSDNLQSRYGTLFSGPGLEGSLSLSHGKVMGDGRLLAELRLRATDAPDNARERAPLSLVIVLDTSGSMSGDKIREAKRSVIELLEQMRSDDEVAFVRYDSNAELIQSMGRVGEVKSSLIERIQGMQADGGTNIPGGLREALRALEGAGGSRVRRVVLVSDGLDAQRDEAEMLAREASDKSATVSSLGIGLDFDEAYMSSVARSGRGNFGFVENAGALARFLQRELNETATTTIERATARLRLPRGLRLVRAVGADAKTIDEGLLEVSMGSLFAGDERRVVIELASTGTPGDMMRLDGEVTWQPVGRDHARASIDALQVLVSTDSDAVAESRDPAVHARCVSALASVRQLEAAAAYARGDTAEADKLIQDNLGDLEEAKETAPEPVAKALTEQGRSYSETREKFRAAPPGSDSGRGAAKRAAEQDNKNLDRFAY